MAKFTNDDVLDAALSEIKDNCNLMTICNAQPTTRTEAVTTYALADVTMVSGDFTIANGDVSGRKLTVAAKSSVTIDVTGTGRYVALVDSTRLLHVTTCNAISLTATEQKNIPSWDIEVRDPT